MPASTTIISSPKRSSVQFIPNSPMPPRGIISRTLDTYNLAQLSRRALSIACKWWHGRPARELPQHARCKEQILAKISRLAILHIMKTEDHANSGTGVPPVNSNQDHAQDHAQDARATIKKRRGTYLPHW